MNLTIAQLRTRAIKILIKEESRNGYISLDYLIDERAREALDLPPRPEGQDPYVGWMIGGTTTDVEVSKTSQQGIDLIKKWEGFRAKAYLCPAQVWTIGYGHTGNVSPGQTISKVKAEELLRLDVERFERTVNEKVKVDLNQNQFDALVSFTYNIGSSAFTKSTLLRLLNQLKYQAAAMQFHRWVRGGGQKLPGLVSRRQDEYNLFTK